MTPVVAVAPQNAFIVIRRQYDRAAVPYCHGDRYN
jgi:predicted P-loop ATPase/GTPase